MASVNEKLGGVEGESVKLKKKSIELEHRIGDVEVAVQATQKYERRLNIQLDSVHETNNEKLFVAVNTMAGIIDEPIVER